jgi:beta-galactosidase
MNAGGGKLAKGFYGAFLAATFCAFAAGRQVVSFDADWRFLKGDAAGAEKAEFDDSGWRGVSVPHDWSIEGPFDAKNPTGGAGGFLPAGVGWYRKHFMLSAADAKRRVFVEFDGVMANSDVWVNGFHLGKRPYGYVSFAYDMTGHVAAGEGNVLAVRADNSGQPASRWYTGAGIYRHVRLVVTDAVHLEHWSTFVTTPTVSAGGATVRVASTVVNQGDGARNLAMEISVLAPDGKVAGMVESKPQSVAAGKSADFQEELSVKAPDRWDIGHGALYRAVVRVRDGKTVLDDETEPFGIREFHFDADTGFWLNGRNFKIKGAALHHDGGAVGAAVPLLVWERRLELLRQVGANAVRTAHNPQSPEFLDLCDRMGFLVMDEMFDCWTVAKNPYDYHRYFSDWSRIDTRDTVRRDRNHPSVIVYSAGNEIHDTPKADLAKEILKGLVEVFHENDPTRPVTQALFRPNVSHDYDNGLADLLDVVGQNYRENEILAAHAAKPTRKILGTENQLGRAVWLALRDNAPYSGQFLWAGFDYLGESRMWPVIADSLGLFDRTGRFKPSAYERQSWWSDQPMVYAARRVARPAVAPTDPGYEASMRLPAQELFSDWTPANTASHMEDVEVYSNCEEVELLLNGKSLGSKTLPADASPRLWSVPFEVGSLRAVGKNKGAASANYELRAGGQAARIVLAADRTSVKADWDDVVYVTATVVDANGVAVPGADNLISFAVAGPGAIAGVDNGDASSHESFQAKERHAFQGRAIAIVKASAASGRITVTGSAAGLAAGSASIAAGGK